MGQTSKLVADCIMPKSVGVTCQMIHFTDPKDFYHVLYHLVYLKQYYTKPYHHSLLIIYANYLPNSNWSVKFILNVYSTTKLY